MILINYKLKKQTIHPLQSIPGFIFEIERPEIIETIQPVFAAEKKQIGAMERKSTVGAAGRDR
jgi:hypothetical protein